jgi:magnesium and cobalt transporter
MSDITTSPQPILKRLMQRLRGETPSSAAMRESLEEVIEESERKEPALSQQERVMLANLLGFGELKVSDVMVPRAQILAVDEDTPMSELVALFRDAKHSRLPVYRETLDDPTGLVHVKDVLTLLEPDGAGGYRPVPSSIARLKRPILFAPPSMRALDLLLKMQASHTHLALVIDEYGGTDGLVSIEDIIE